MAKTKRLLLNLLLIAAPLILLEVVFRFLPVSSPPPLMPVTAERPVVQYQANQDFRFSTDWNFAISTSKHSNNSGYINQVDYEENSNSPLLTVIGDSFVEAYHVDRGQSFAELLHADVAGRGRVYSIGVSGAPLSQYLVFADYARRLFRPKAMLFVIISNDFDESLYKYKSEPRFHYFVECDGDLVLQRVDYRPSRLKLLLRRSAFIRYVVLNLRAKQRLAQLLARTGLDETDSPVYTATKDAELEAEARRAVDRFFDLLGSMSGLDASQILFVIDANRPALYTRQPARSGEQDFSTRMKGFFAKRAQKLGYGVIDLHPAFAQRHRADGTRFEFDNNPHWNRSGHAVVAEEVRKTALYRSLFDH